MIFDAAQFAIVMLYGTPILALVLFLVALIDYVFAKRKNKNKPGTYSETKMKHKKIALIITGVIAGIFVLLILALIALLTVAVAFM